MTKPQLKPASGGGGGGHRPGLFKIAPKKHSTGRHRTKSAIAREQKGKQVGIKAQGMQKRRDLGRTERRHRNAQIRANKGAKLIEQRRMEGGAPHLVTVISLDNGRTAEQLVAMFEEADAEAVASKEEQSGIYHLNVPRFRARYAFLCPPTTSSHSSSIHALLDALRASDLLLLFWPLGVECLMAGQAQLLATVLAQGVPTTLNIVAGMPKAGKQRETARKQLDRAMRDWPKERDRVHDLNNPGDALQLLRLMSAVKKSHSNLQRQRPYLVAEHVQMDGSEQISSDDGLCTLMVSGYLRGTPMSVNKLVHLPGWGDFQLKRIEQAPDPHSMKRNRTNEMTDDTTTVLAEADPAKQTPLDAEIVPDPMEGEQLCPDEGVDDADKFAVPKVKKRVPAGTSDYQASWLIDDDENAEDETSDEEEEEGSDGSEDDQEDGGGFEEQMEKEEDEEAGKAEVMSERMDTEADEEEADAELDEAERQRFLSERENAKWPDEVETPRDTPARQRFQRYRGLKSFRTSPWDPKENLPRDYARIYNIVNFKRTRKLAFAETRDAFEVVEPGEWVQPGTFVTLHIAGVPKQFCDSLMSPSCPPVVYGLLRHEHRMSVLNMVLRKHPSCSAVIKSKDQLVFQVGCRRFAASPLFSQHTNGQKFKLERFMPAEGAFCATVYAPITFPPTTVLVFCRAPHTQSLQLVAFGIVLNMRPDRIVLKRTVLSGHPYKVNKRTAVVRYMFYNREDVDWFKPVELYTHGGRRGRIKQALGTHGLMKCMFDQPMSVQDSVLLNLYKRVFPKWDYNGRIATMAIYDKSVDIEEEEKSDQNKVISVAGKPVRFTEDEPIIMDV